MSVLRFAAQSAFRKFSKQQRTKLAKDLYVAPANPPLLALAQAFVEHIIPCLAPEELRRILSLRGQ
eukprot:11830244-Alexandrium_andersonii.AAC.1